MVYDVHLVFLEGGILGQLHKKPKVLWLMGCPSNSKNASVVFNNDVRDVSTKDADCDIIETGAITADIPAPKPKYKLSVSADSSDHMYASLTPLVLCDVRHDKVHTDHTYAELSDFPTEPYGSDSDSQNDVVTTSGKFIISSSDKVEINHDIVNHV